MIFKRQLKIHNCAKRNLYSKIKSLILLLSLWQYSIFSSKLIGVGIGVFVFIICICLFQFLKCTHINFNKVGFSLTKSKGKALFLYSCFW